MKIIKLFFHLLLLMQLHLPLTAQVTSQLVFTTTTDEVQTGFDAVSNSSDHLLSASPQSDGFTWFKNLSTTAQLRGFPTCDNLEVIQIDFQNTDSLTITVYNNCDDCAKHVYTGLEVYNSNSDLVAESLIPQSEQTPDNNSERAYFLKKLQSFDLQDISRIKMTSEICDSLKIKPLVSSVNASAHLETGISISPNPSIDFITVLNPGRVPILNIKIIDEKGRIVRTITSDFYQLDITDLSKGIYFIMFQSDEGLDTKKLIKK